MFMVEIDENYINAEHTKNRTEDEMIRVYQVLLKRITEAGVCSKKNTS